MTGAIFGDAICAAPWGFAVPMKPFAHILAPGTERVVGYHLVIDGKAVVGLAGTAEVPVVASDISIIPHGEPHTVVNGAPSKLIDSSASLERWLTGDASTMRIEGDLDGGSLKPTVQPASRTTTDQYPETVPVW